MLNNTHHSIIHFNDVRYEIDIDTDPDSDLDVAASDPGWITDAVWMDNSKHMVYTSSLRSEKCKFLHKIALDV